MRDGSVVPADHQMIRAALERRLYEVQNEAAVHEEEHISLSTLTTS